MDASMPRMNGFAAAREIRRLERERGARRIPIVALTADVLGAAADAWREAGMDGILHKPFTLAALAAELGRFLSPTISPPKPESLPAAPAPTDRRLPSLSPISKDDVLFDSQIVAQLETFAGNGRGDFVTKVFQLYINNAPRCLANIISSAEAGDAEALSEASHALKSMSFNIGAKAVADAARVIEARSTNGERLPPDITRDLGKLVRNTVATLEMAL
jgi:two-component system sensor histidine kinase BarA